MIYNLISTDEFDLFPIEKVHGKFSSNSNQLIFSFSFIAPSLPFFNLLFYPDCDEQRCNSPQNLLL